jgi:hypothetical protein
MLLGAARRWGLGVLLYVLLTGRQPFSSPKTDDPMVVMRRIVDDNWHVKYPPYLSGQAKARPCSSPLDTAAMKESMLQENLVSVGQEDAFLIGTIFIMHCSCTHDGGC